MSWRLAIFSPSEYKNEWGSSSDMSNKLGSGAGFEVKTFGLFGTFDKSFVTVGVAV
jgi:hypothetical protein